MLFSFIADLVLAVSSMALTPLLTPAISALCALIGGQGMHCTAEIVDNLRGKQLKSADGGGEPLYTCGGDGTHKTVLLLAAKGALSLVAIYFAGRRGNGTTCTALGLW